jgi:hypothetical protein
MLMLKDRDSQIAVRTLVELLQCCYLLQIEAHTNHILLEGQPFSQ